MEDTKVAITNSPLSKNRFMLHGPEMRDTHHSAQNKATHVLPPNGVEFNVCETAISLKVSTINNKLSELSSHNTIVL